MEPRAVQVVFFRGLNAFFMSMYVYFIIGMLCSWQEPKKLMNKDQFHMTMSKSELFCQAQPHELKEYL